MHKYSIFLKKIILTVSAKPVFIGSEEAEELIDFMG